MTPLPAAVPEGGDFKRDVAHELNGLFRRFRQYETDASWVSLVMEGTGLYARQAALFVVAGDVLETRAALDIELPANLRITAAKAAAFEAVLRSKEAVTALRTNSEVGAELSSPGKLAYLFPILNGPRVAAILFTAAGEESEIAPLELVCGMASCALERPANAGALAQIATKPALQQPQTAPSERRLPPWAGMPAAQRTLHSQAARFARVSVAEMQLAKPVACRTAREKGDLYVLLAKEIDKGRETYRKQFMTIPSMVDYFHRELIGAVLDGDATKLGADYPGELA